MKRTKLILAVLAAITGIGGAYASQPKADKAAVNYNWHTIHGALVFVGTTLQAGAKCVAGAQVTCLKGTLGGVVKTIFTGTYHN